MRTAIIILFMITGLLESRCNNKPTSDEAKLAIEVDNIASLQIDNKNVFKGEIFKHATVTKYPDQILFSLIDDEGQNVTITFAGKNISSRKPTALIFDAPGLFHGYSESGDVFFIAFSKLDADREPGQMKYERHWPQHIMEGKLTVVSWTDSSFEFEFEGKLGNEKEVDSPDNWLSFAGRIKAEYYQLYEE